MLTMGYKQATSYIISGTGPPHTYKTAPYTRTKPGSHSWQDESDKKKTGHPDTPLTQPSPSTQPLPKDESRAGSFPASLCVKEPEARAASDSGAYANNC